MEEDELLFTVDGRSMQGEMQFGEVPGTEFSKKEVLENSLREIYQKKFSNVVSAQLRTTLVGIISGKISVEHSNLTFLVAATWIVHMTGEEITPAQFDNYYKSIAPKLIGNMTKKSKDEIRRSHTGFKVTLLRYIYYVRGFMFPPKKKSKGVQGDSTPFTDS